MITFVLSKGTIYVVRLDAPPYTQALLLEDLDEKIRLYILPAFPSFSIDHIVG
jgi:hypothetical protein